MEPVNSWVALIVFFGMIWVVALLSLQGVAYVGKKIRKAWAGRRSASPSPSGSAPLLPDGYFAPRELEKFSTPDRPTDPFLQKAKAEIVSITGRKVAVNYPEGS